MRELRATREVIVCGGAVNSPHLLQISGIGPADHLHSIGVETLHNLQGVGANLQDHYVARVSHRVRGSISTNQLATGLRLLGEAVKFATTGRGALTAGVTTAQVFCESREGLASPDLQLLFTPASYDPNRFGKLEREAGMTVAVCPVRPDSRGTIMATSPDPFARPRIQPNYLSAPSDQTVLGTGIRLTRNIFAAPALAQHSVLETLPGPHVQSDADLLDYMRNFGNTLPPRRHLPHGRRPRRRGRFPPARSRHIRIARYRRLSDARADLGQYQCPHNHDRRKRRYDDPGGQQIRQRLFFL